MLSLDLITTIIQSNISSISTNTSICQLYLALTEQGILFGLH